MNLQQPRRKRRTEAPPADIDKALATLDLQRTPRGRIAQDGRPVVVVLGMHRSGTALLANMLHYLGADMADHTDPISSKNPNGFWERPEIVALHDDVLGLIRRPVDSPLHALPFPSGWWRDKKLQPLKVRLTEIVRKHLAETNGTWGFKDPRTCRLLPLWSEIFEALDLRPHYVWAIRTPGEAAASMAAKNPRVRPISAQHAEVMWLAYNYDILRHLIGTHPTIVDYGEWFDDPLTIGRRLLRRLELRGLDTEREFADCIHGIFHSEFRHFVEGHGDASSSIPLAQGLFKDLAELSRSEAAASEERLGRYLGLLEIIFGTLQPFAQSLSEVPSLRKAIRLGEERVTELTAKSEELAARADQLAAMELHREAEFAALHAKSASLDADLDAARVSIEELASTLSVGGDASAEARHEGLVPGRRAGEMEETRPPSGGTQPRPVGDAMKEPAENSAPLAVRMPDRKDLTAPLRESELARLQAKAANLQAQLDQAVDQASDIVGQLASRTQERDEFASRLNIREAAFAALKANGAKIRAELEATTQRSSELVAELDASKKSSAAFQVELEALASDKQTLVATLTEVRADGRRAVALHTQTQTRLKAALATERERGDRLEAHIEALRAEHAASLGEARRQIAEIDQALKAAKDALDQNIREREGFSAELMETKASLAQAGQEKERLSARLAQSERGRDEVSAQLVQAAAEKKDLSAKLKEAEASRDDFSSRLAQAERSRKDLSEKLQQNGRDKESLAARLVKADRDNVDLAAKLETAARKTDSLAARLSKADRDKIDIAAKLETATRKTDSLAARLSKADRDKVDIAAKLEIATRETDSLAARLSKADRDKVDIAARLETATRETDRLAARLSKADRDKLDLAATLLKVDRDKVDMAAKFETATGERNRLAARLQKADRERAELTASLSGSEANRRELQIASEGYLARIDAQSKKPFIRRLFSSSGRRRSLSGQAKGAVASIKLDPGAGVEGFLDQFGPSRIQGWLYRPDRPSETLRIALYDGERFLCTAVADRARADVARKGKMTGRCGFDLPVPQQLLDGKIHTVDIRLAGSAASLLPRPFLIKLDVQSPGKPNL